MQTVERPVRVTETAIHRDSDGDRYVGEATTAFRINHTDRAGVDEFRVCTGNGPGEPLSAADLHDLAAACNALLAEVDPSGVNRQRPVDVDTVAYRAAVRDVIADNTLTDIDNGLEHLGCCTYPTDFERAVWTEARQRLVDLEEHGDPIDASCRCGGQGGCGQCGDRYGCVALTGSATRCRQLPREWFPATLLRVGWKT